MKEFRDLFNFVWEYVDKLFKAVSVDVLFYSLLGALGVLFIVYILVLNLGFIGKNCRKMRELAVRFSFVKFSTDNIQGMLSQLCEIKHLAPKMEEYAASHDRMPSDVITFKKITKGKMHVVPFVLFDILAAFIGVIGFVLLNYAYQSALCDINAMITYVLVMFSAYAIFKAVLVINLNSLRKKINVVYSEFIDVLDAKMEEYVLENQVIEKLDCSMDFKDASLKDEIKEEPQQEMEVEVEEIKPVIVETIEQPNIEPEAEQIAFATGIADSEDPADKGKMYINPYLVDIVSNESEVAAEPEQPIEEQTAEPASEAQIEENGSEDVIEQADTQVQYDIDAKLNELKAAREDLRKKQSEEVGELLKKAKAVSETGAKDIEAVKTMQQIALLLQREKEKNTDRSESDIKRLNESLSDLLKAMSKGNKQ